ncbi:hypothetical protein [Pseudoalteromonas umbrosa]|uniref:hypothetical protein n=1 Tax=Pseudoalteromonas umbrosa TaxID=3048489 RepID=UPI0024C3A5B7|nr:hypothetical protein [Pseudoalteromonas sp. B95]MDK1289819.1 hypothetical protein [Pseudoalteromonas sp. B95]
MSTQRKLMRARAWAKLHFAEGSVPGYTILREWVINGYVDGELIGDNSGQAYIYEDQKPGMHSKAKEFAQALALSE